MERDAKTRTTVQHRRLGDGHAFRQGQATALADGRPEALLQGSLAETVEHSPQIIAQHALSDRLHKSPRMIAQRKQVAGFFGDTLLRQRAPGEQDQVHGNFKMLQRRGMEEEGLQMKYGARAGGKDSFEPASRDNNTGLPDQLKSGIESLSGISLDHVKVHYNSPQPAQLNALAYAQGSNIYLAPGQEQHLPHEAWHVVQQAQGRVKPTMQMKGGVPVNDEKSLEREADVMGAAAKTKQVQNVVQHEISQTPIQTSTVSCVQRVLGPEVFMAMWRRLGTTLNGVSGISPSSSNASDAWTRMLGSVDVLAHSSPTGWSDEAVVDAIAKIEVCERVDAKPFFFGRGNWEKRQEALATFKGLINSLDRDVQQQKLDSIAAPIPGRGRGFQPTITHLDASGTRRTFAAGPRDNPQPPPRPNFAEFDL